MMMCKLCKLKSVVCKNKFFLLVFLLFSIFNFSVFAEYLSSEKFGYTLDLPDGFYVSDSNDTGYFLESDFIPIEIIINVYEGTRFKSTKECLEFSSSKLQGEIQIEDFSWRNRQTSLGSMNFYFNNVLCDSWALCVNLPDKNKYLSIITYTANESKEIFKQMMLSILDSLCVDRGSFFESGVITTFAFPKTESQIHQFDFDGKSYQVNFDKYDADANNYLVEREYQILELYSQTDFWLSAWNRYYRMIYRDGFGRIKKACFGFCSNIFMNCMESENPQVAFAQKMLQFVQEKQYGRTPEGTDFTDLCSTFLGKQSDCDSRSLLVAILLNQMNIKSTLFVSPEYSHAIVGAVLDKSGAKIDVAGNSYLLGETTAKVEFGLIGQNFNDTDKWINILLPE
jgi:hypothetical protein